MRVRSARCARGVWRRGEQSDPQSTGWAYPRPRARTPLDSSSALPRDRRAFGFLRLWSFRRRPDFLGELWNLLVLVGVCMGMSRSRRGSDPEFAAFVSAHWQRMVRTAGLLCVDPMRAEDVTQDCLIKALSAWSKVQKADNPTAYVYRILINCAKNASRSVLNDTRTMGEVSNSGELFDSMSRHLDTLAMRDAITSLPRQAREVLVLRYYLDLSERDAAEVLNVPVGTVKSRLSRAISSLSNDPRVLRYGGIS